MIENRIHLAYLPTPISKLDNLSKKLQKNIYIKRDDLTGLECSGNKIRKLEYVVKDAIDTGAKVLITCGGIQSNHARATVAVANKLGLEVHLVLRGDKYSKKEGNYFLDLLMGSKITYLSSEEFNHHEDVMDKLKTEYETQGKKAYIIPIGASNSIGNFGYYNCLKEITEQEKTIGVKFDAIVCTIGSGGTYAGLLLGKIMDNKKTSIIGFNISNNAEYFKNIVEEIAKESLNKMKVSEKLINNISWDEEIKIIDGYAGLGYAISQPSELDFIRDISRVEGLILDPVYTGKCFLGLVDQINKGNFNQFNNILFIHTGGIFGLFPFVDQFDL